MVNGSLEHSELIVEPPFPAYDGDEPFIFVSYAHDDSSRVFKELAWLREAGVNIWYDEGIAPGSHWHEALATAIDGCALFVVFLTKQSVQSENCVNEMDYALGKHRPFLWVELEPVELPHGVELSIGNRQGLLKHRLNEPDYRQKLLRAAQHPSTTASRYYQPIANVVRRPWRTATIVGLVIAILAVGYLFRGEETRPDITSIAVLPFQNLSGDVAQDYLADGLADELINQLGRVPALSVASRTSSFYYKTHPLLMEDIRQRLGVAHAVEGSVLKGDQYLTINTNLFDTDTGRQVWSDSYDTNVDRVSDIPAEVAQRIVDVLVPDAVPEALLAKSPQVKAAAYHAYLKGLDYLRRPPAPAVLNAAIAHFEQALKEAPDYARAYAALCETHLAFYRMVRSEDAEAHFNAAQGFCEQSLTLDNTLWEGRQSLATLYRHVGRFENALEEIRLADALHPNTASVHHELGKTLAELDAPVQAENVLKRAIALDVGFWGGYADLGDFLYVRGRYAEALEQFSKVHELSPDNGLALVSLGAAHYLLDDRDAAEAVWRLAVTEHAGSESRAYWQAATWLGINQLLLGCFDAAAYWQRQAISVSPNDHRLWGRYAESCQLQTADVLSDSASDAYARAIALAEAELQNNPNDWQSLGFLAMYRSRTGVVEETRELVDRMLALQPENPDALEIALHVAVQSSDEEGRNDLTRRLLALGFPRQLLDRDPFLGEAQVCPDRADLTETWDCTSDGAD